VTWVGATFRQRIRARLGDGRGLGLGEVFAPKSPVSAEAGAWVVRSLDWCVEEFGLALIGKPVLLPEDFRFARGHYTGTLDDVETILVRVCERMDVDRASIDLELTPSDPDPELATYLPGQVMTKTSVAGHFQRRGERFVIALAEAQLPEPVAVVAVIAHELGHVRLLGEGRIRPDQRDGEQLADLVTVALGLGLFNANASFEFRQSNRGWRSSWLGYLSEEMFGYALAQFARLREETDPAWARRLDPNPRGYMKRATRWLENAPPPS
jgi:hypothetical protein